MEKRLLLACLLSGTILLSFGSTPPPRDRLLIDRNWKFHLGDTTSAEKPEFNDQGWEGVNLPHDWSRLGPFSKDAPSGGRGGYLPTGIGWYRRVFELPTSARGRLVSVQFDGVYQNSQVWINGHLLGKRPNGYITFTYALNPFIHPGKNVIAVRVDNSMQPNSRWYSGSGIYRHVWLVETYPVHVDTWGTFVSTPFVNRDSAAVSVRTTVDNEGAAALSGVLVSAVVDSSGRKLTSVASPFSLSGGSASVIAQAITIPSPLLWSVSHPYMYTLVTTILANGKLVDEYHTPFGVRQIEYSSSLGFLLNGYPVKMNGVCLHHDGGCVGAAVPLKIWEERLRLLKEMGCNAIRTSHNPPAPEFLDLCDRMGFLVMDEAFDAWETGKLKYDYSIYFDEWWERDVVDQVHRDRNHPCVVMWSAGNEVPDQTKDKGVELLRNIQSVFHREDPTRPVTVACDDIAADNGATKLEFLNTLDIVGYNYVDRWHERRELMYDADRYIHPDWKVVGTESGSVHEPPLYSLGHDPSLVRANYTSGMIQAEQLWKFIAVRPFVIGDFMWTGVDYLGEAFWPNKGAYSGVIDRSDVCKDAYYFYQSQWVSQPVLHLFPHWNWKGREGQIIPVLAYTNCDTVELFLNGKSYGVKAQEFPRQGNSGAWNKYARPFVRTNTADLHLSWDVAYQPGTLLAVGYKNGKKVIEDSVVTSGAPYSLMISTDTASLLADGQDAVLVHVSVLDSLGHIVPDASVPLAFTLEGEGRVIGTDNGNPADDHLFPSPRCNAWKGHAFAVVQAGLHPGNLRVIVNGEGLRAASVSLQIRNVPADRPQFLP